MREWGAWLAARGVTPGAKRDVLRLPAHMAPDTIGAGQGIGLTTRRLVEGDIADGRLAALFDDDDSSPGAGYWRGRRAGRLRPPAAAFAAWLKREAARN